MAKKRSTGLTATTSGMHVQTDEIFQQMQEDVAAKFTKRELDVEQVDLYAHMPLPALSLRVLLQSECWPSSRFHQLIGREASYKSTFANEIARWHGYLWGGLAALAEAETKDNDMLRNFVHRWHNPWLDYRMCDSLEDWQSYISFNLESGAKRLTVKDDRLMVPFMNYIDSLTGKGTRAMMKKVKEDGHASKGYPEVAQLITRYVQCQTQLLRGWPWSIVGVNHMKKTLEEGDNYQDNIPGGRELAYQSCFIIYLQALAPVDYVNQRVVPIKMMLLKNSIGMCRVPIIVPLRFWQQNDAPGVPPRTHAEFDWFTASIMLLMGEGGWGDKMKSRVLSRVDEIVHIGEKSAGNQGKLYWSKELGVPSSDPVPAQQLSMVLESRTDILEAIYPILGVDRMRHLPYAVASMARRPGYEWVTAQATSADEKVTAMEQLKEQQTKEIAKVEAKARADAAKAK